jgi:hypothetical protein
MAKVTEKTVKTPKKTLIGKIADNRLELAVYVKQPNAPFRNR